MTDEQKEQAKIERLERARAIKKARALLAERSFQARVSRAFGRMDPEDQTKLRYIHEQLRRGHRDPEDIDSLRETRTRILRPYGLQEAS